MPDTNASHGEESDRARSADKLYAEICANMRATDDYSFRLLGFVPLASGGGIVALFLKLKATGWATIPVVMLSLVGATVTLGLFCWELRNIQTCKWLRDCARVVERQFGLPLRPEPHKVFGVAIRKETAEMGVYATTIAAWLALAVLASRSVP